MNYSLTMDNTHTAEPDDSDIPSNPLEDESYIHSCTHCEKIVLSLDYDFDMWCEENEWANIHFSITLGDMLEAFRAGCEFAEGLFSSHTLLQMDLPETLTLCAHFQDHTMDPVFCDHVGLFGLWNAVAKKVEYTFDSYDSFSVCTSSGNAASEEILTRPINVHPFSHEFSQLCRSRLRECHEVHMGCRGIVSKFVPTRVIEITENWHLRLRQNLEPFTPFTALSYCWGPSELMERTTRNSLSSFMTDLPWGKLPKTIQDAIRVTHQLGIGYLWVDALCIIQDDQEDKTREISLMGRIYSQAEVTIVASRPKTAQEGFLHPRILSEQPAFILPFRCANGNIGSVRMFQAYGHNGPEPLDVRGWAMQERLLARRILEFGTRQTRFTCRDDIVGYGDGWMPHPEFHIGRHDMLLERHQGNEAAQRPSMLSVVKDWHWLIWSYTTRQLTVESDRILAISSVAEIYASSIPGHYLAGLWSSAMPTDLLWMVQKSFQKRPAAFQGPSWSWSSVNGQIWSFLCSGAVCFRRFPCDVKIIDDTQLQLESASAPFGAIKYGHLTVRGRIKRAEWKQERQRGSEVLCDRLRIPYAPDEFLALRAFSDAEELDGFGVDWAPIHLLLIWGSSRRSASQESAVPVDRGGDGYTGLLLREKDVSTFTRIGIFEFVPEYDPSYEGTHPETECKWRARFPYQSVWFHDGEEKTITII